MSYQLFAVALKHINDRYLNHGVAARLLVHRGACHVHQHLSGKCRVVDAHIKL